MSFRMEKFFLANNFLLPLKKHIKYITRKIFCNRFLFLAKYNQDLIIRPLNRNRIFLVVKGFSKRYFQMPKNFPKHKIIDSRLAKISISILTNRNRYISIETFPRRKKKLQSSEKDRFLCETEKSSLYV